jgi:hypothetical protein
LGDQSGGDGPEGFWKLKRKRRYFHNMTSILHRAWLLFFYCCFALTATATTNTFVYLISDPGDYIGGGQVQALTPGTGTLTASHTGNTVSVSYNGTNQWTFDFAAPQNSALVAGNYEDAGREGFQSPTKPGLDASGAGRGSNTLTGRFIVWEAVYSPTGDVVSFAADFCQHSDGAVPALYGIIRINSDVPLLVPGPHAAPGANSSAIEGDSVMLNGSNSTDYDGTIVSYQWQQLSGPSATLNSPLGAQTTFVAPPVPVGGQDLVFQLRVTDQAGRTDISDVTVHVASQYDPQFSIVFVSQAGDYIGGGKTWKVTKDDGLFSIASNFDNGVTVNFDGDSSWTLDFAGIGNAPLQSGVLYSNAALYPLQTVNQPGLDVYGDGRGSDTVTGQFYVLSIGYNADNSIASFEAILEQHSGGAVPALYALVCYNYSKPK